MSYRITYKDFYLNYPYKTRDLTSNTVALPYFPKAEISNHKHALTYQDWLKIIKCYLGYVLKYILTTGLTFKIPSSLGEFKMLKRKAYFKPKINWKATKEYNKKNISEKYTIIKYRNVHSNGYSPFFKWYRTNGRNARFKYKYFWRFDLTRPVWSKISKMIDNDLKILHKFSEA